MHGAEPLKGREVQLAARPNGELRAGGFRIVDVVVREPTPGEVLVRNTWTSVDPGLKLRLPERAPAGYFPPFRAPGVAGRDHDDRRGHRVPGRGFAAGDTVWHASGWRDYAVVAAGTPALGGLGTLARLDPTLLPRSGT
jgi:NADPH-dependent curcumin reductase CurA